MKAKILKRYLHVATVFVTLQLISSSAFANLTPEDEKQKDLLEHWNFSCNKEVKKELQFLKPNILIMLDRSGSMRQGDGEPYIRKVCNSSGYCENIQDYLRGSKWDRARSAIIELFDKNVSDDGSFHISYGFANYSSEVDILNKGFTCSPDKDCKEDFSKLRGNVHEKLRRCKRLNQMKRWLYGTRWRAYGSTQTGLALKYAANENFSRCHQFRNIPNGDGTYKKEKVRPSATLLITDGVPDDGFEAFAAACFHRETAGPVYTVGFGAGTDESYNSFLAAAGGTGTCEKNNQPMKNPCDYKEDLKKYAQDRNLDPKNVKLFNPENGNLTSAGQEIFNNIIRRYRHTVRKRGDTIWRANNGIVCTGSYSANSTEELIDALKNITKSMSCIYPLSIGGVSGSSVPEDVNKEYPWVRIMMQPKGQSVAKRVPFKESRFRNKNKSDGWYWSFSDDNRNYIVLGPQACEATRAKTVDSVSTHVGCYCGEVENSQCLVKDWKEQKVCPKGEWRCKYGLDRCEPTDYTEFDKCTPDNLHGPCSRGQYVCSPNGAVSCVPKVHPMPELCNAIDDDCDGSVDNISASWNKTEFASGLASYEANDQDNYALTRQRACDAKDSCSCSTEVPDPDPELTPDGTQFPQSIVDYTQAWESRHGKCECVAD